VRRSATRDAAEAIRRAAERQAGQVPRGQEAVVLSLPASATGLSVELTSSRLVLDEDDLIVSQAVEQYDVDYGLAEGDTLFVLPSASGRWHALAVITETEATERGTGTGTGAGGAVTIADGGDVAEGSTTDPDTANTVVGLLKRITGRQTDASQKTQVTNWPGSTTVTGAVSVTSMPALDVSDRAARLVGHVTVDNLPTTQPVSGSVVVSNFPATQPVSGSVGTTVADGANVALGTTTDGSSVKTVIGLLVKATNSLAAALKVVGNKDPGTSAVAVAPVLGGGVDPGVLARVFLTDTAGRQQVLANGAPSATATATNVASSTTSVTLLAANANRLGVAIRNDSTSALYISLGSSASSASVYELLPGDLFTLPEPGLNWTGAISGVWLSASGFARVLEMTA
jgi:hypothetical protein